MIKFIIPIILLIDVILSIIQYRYRKSEGYQIKLYVIVAATVVSVVISLFTPYVITRLVRAVLSFGVGVELALAMNHFRRTDDDTWKKVVRIVLVILMFVVNMISCFLPGYGT